MEAMIVTLVVNAIAPFFLEKGKWSRLFPLMQPVAPVLNTVTSFLVALAAQAGIVYTFDPVAHTLLVSGLDADKIVKALIGAAVGFFIQKVVYKFGVKE